jgi:DNA repair exonuclease SbcCD ATPase subunit
LKTKIGNIVNFLGKHPEFKNEISVNTRFGYKLIEAAAVTKANSTWLTIKTLFRKIECSTEHKLLCHATAEFVFANTLKVGDLVHTIDGPEKIISIVESTDREDLVDIQVADVNEFYANGVVSHNSTIANLITFGLFNQTIKNINRPQIVNSVNQKDLVVEIEFESRGKSYLVRRGIKPNIFEIFENGLKLDQTNSGDFQEYLELNIIGTNMKTFLQTSVLSVENYKPFMTLRTQERRAFIEEILDIKVFSFMNQILKSKISKYREEIKLIDLELKNCFTKAKLQKSHIERIENIRGNSTAALKSKLKTLQEEKSSLELKVNQKNVDIDAAGTLLKVFKKKLEDHQAHEEKIKAYDAAITKHLEKIDSITHKDSCPVCASLLDEKAKLVIVEPSVTKMDELTTKKNELVVKLHDYKELTNGIEKANSVISESNSCIFAYNSTINRLNKEISSLFEEIADASKSEELSDLKAELKQTAQEALSLKDKQSKLNAEQDYNNLMIELFKDSGIKTKIIDQYIPIINDLINGYLEKLDFFISFNLDSEFNEIIKSRHRDDFTYGSFSAGEKTRIDTALLLTFRQLSKIRNSFDCNVLFLDEILECLDQKGIDNFLTLIEDLEEFKTSNIYIISHKSKDQLAEVFDGNLLMYKESGFSLVKDLSK